MRRQANTPLETAHGADSSTATTPNSPRTPTSPFWTAKRAPRPQIVDAPGSERYPLAVVNRCDNSTTFSRGGHYASMSHQGPAARPASYPPSTSAVKTENSPALQHIQQHEPGRAVPDHVKPPAPGSSSLGMYSISNPPPYQPPTTQDTTSQGPPPRPWRHDSPARGPPVEHPGPHVPRTFYSGPPLSASLPTTPAGKAASSGRGSPAVGYPFPPTEPRRILSPKSPRQSSLQFEHAPQDARGYRPAVQSTAGAKRPYNAEGPEGYRRMPHGPPTGHSQPAIDPYRSPHNVHSHSTAPIDAHGHPLSQAALGYPPHGPPPAPHQANAPSTAGPPNWSEPVQRLGGPLLSGDGQAYIQLPGSSVPIPIEVDYSHASRKADEKRQRNAKASTRHRRKKKTIQEETAKQLQDLREERYETQRRMEEVARQREFYREERNRLRDLVVRTPGISHLVNGPPSPPLVQVYPLPPDHWGEGSGPPHSGMRGYGSDSSSVERQLVPGRSEEPVDHHARYATSAGRSSLPPPHGTVPPRPPSAASSGQGEKLPSMRSIDSQLVGPGYAPTQHQDPRRDSGVWDPARRQYEQLPGGSRPGDTQPR